MFLPRSSLLDVRCNHNTSSELERSVEELESWRRVVTRIVANWRDNKILTKVFFSLQRMIQSKTLKLLN